MTLHKQFALFFLQAAYKLLDLSVRLRELGNPEYIERMVNIFLNCAINREEAEQRVCVKSIVCVLVTAIQYIIYTVHQLCTHTNIFGTSSFSISLPVLPSTVLSLLI